MEVQPIGQIEAHANVELVEDICEYLETLTDKEEDTEDYHELNFED